jgi:hypothetical protein
MHALQNLTSVGEKAAALCSHSPTRLISACDRRST